MPVYIPLRIKRNRNEIALSVKVNSGFETPIDPQEGPLPLITISDDEWVKLGQPKKLKGLEAQPVVRPCYRVEATIACEDAPEEWITVYVVVLHEREYVMNEYLAHRLGIVLIDIYEGLWRLRSDPLNKIRKSKL